MECEDIHRLLDAYLHRELDRDDQLEAERHLILCPSCASLLQEHQEFRAVFRNTASGRKAPPQGGRSAGGGKAKVCIFAGVLGLRRCHDPSGSVFGLEYRFSRQAERVFAAGGHPSFRLALQ